MWDMNSGKSRGYGFLAFRDKTDAEQAIATMNGEWLGSRAIRVNWANQKTQSGSGGGMPGMPGMPPGMQSMSDPMAMAAPHMGGGGAPAPMNFQGGPLSYESVVGQTPAYNTTVYVGNLVPYCTQADLIPLFQSIGYLSEIRMQADRGFAFVKLDTHENAAMAIVQLQGQLVHGRPIKCSWGKDRSAADTGAPGSSMMPPAAATGAYAGVPMYGMPQPNAYPQYGFGGAGYAGFANGQGSVGAGMPQPNPAQAGAAMGMGGQDAGAMGGQGNSAAAGWGNDPTAFYQQQQYWGGKSIEPCRLIRTNLNLQATTTNKPSPDPTAKTDESRGIPQPNPAQAGAAMGMGGQDAGAMGGQGNSAAAGWGNDPTAFYQQQQYWGGKSIEPCRPIRTNLNLQATTTNKPSPDPTAKTDESRRGTRRVRVTQAL
ncbi:hypothetical protein RSAG8_04489, partial [Rhizoctonia solani AG-8 WAC10335]